jgi:hypothetical protein
VKNNENQKKLRFKTFYNVNLEDKKKFKCGEWTKNFNNNLELTIIIVGIAPLG